MKELYESIWSVSGNEPGKILTVIGGTHGNELTGVKVVLELRGIILSHILKIDKGKFNLILGNPPAIAIGQKRSSIYTQDLNRSYPTDLLTTQPNGNFEDARARLIAPFLIESDVVIDLHSTTNPSEPFLSCLDSRKHEEVYRWFTCDKVLTDPDFVTGGKSVTTDEFTEAHGGIGICYETGEARDTSRVDEVTENIINLMTDLKLVDREAKSPPDINRQIFKLTESIIVTSEGFKFAEGWGNRSWETFDEGDVIAYHGEKPLMMKHKGVLLFPKPEIFWRKGNRAGCIAVKV